MKLRYTSAVLLSLVFMSACNKEKADDKVIVKKEESTSTNITMTKAAEEARKEITTGNMSLHGETGLAKAEITPQGDLLIEGKAVAVTPEQRQLLVKHRELLVNVALSGVEIGLKGVNLAGDAIGEAFKSIFTGDTDQVEKKVDAQAKEIEKTAEALCDQLPLLMESQEKLAKSLPDFKPYATMTVEDINDCHGEIHERK
ncbi:MAG: DUF2884 family protein [Arenimonas sp.]